MQTFYVLHLVVNCELTQLTARKKKQFFIYALLTLHSWLFCESPEQIYLARNFETLPSAHRSWLGIPPWNGFSFCCVSPQTRKLRSWNRKKCNTLEPESLVAQRGARVFRATSGSPDFGKWSAFCRRCRKQSESSTEARAPRLEHFRVPVIWTLHCML